ncbi:MAG: diaminopimelate decarboxylase [Chitinophagaceae bacterium]|nr:MAG: diaminopimelate decarboxylase [Chitinophagaceae bacterium]
MNNAPITTGSRQHPATAVANETLINIAREYGSPVYVYHAETIKQQYQKLRNAFGNAPAVFFYACKALTNINILRYMKTIGSNIDCSSVNEVQLALEAGFAPKNILYTSNNIAFEEIEHAASLGVHINIDSLSNLKKFAKKFGHTYPVGIRLRPNIMAGGNLKISTGHQDSKFGIAIDQLDEVLSLMSEHDLKISGLHIHTGSEIQDFAVFMTGLELLYRLSSQFPDLRFLDLGGGFKVPYKEGETGTDVEALGERIAAAHSNFEKTSGRKLELWFEPGKYLVSECGYLVCQVNVIKQTLVKDFVGVNTGLNHLIRPMFYDAYHRIENISNPSGTRKPYTVVGNICETDTFATDRMLNEVREGDFLVFYNAGAYGFEMASNYNARFKPAEVLIENGQSRLIRRRDTLADLLRNQVV